MSEFSWLKCEYKPGFLKCRHIVGWIFIRYSMRKWFLCAASMRNEFAQYFLKCIYSRETLRWAPLDINWVRHERMKYKFQSRIELKGKFLGIMKSMNVMPQRRRRIASSSWRGFTIILKRRLWRFWEVIMPGIIRRIALGARWILYSYLSPTLWYKDRHRIRKIFTNAKIDVVLADEPKVALLSRAYAYLRPCNERAVIIWDARARAIFGMRR